MDAEAVVGPCGQATRLLGQASGAPGSVLYRMGGLALGELDVNGLYLHYEKKQGRWFPPFVPRACMSGDPPSPPAFPSFVLLPFSSQSAENFLGVEQRLGSVEKHTNTPTLLSTAAH